MKKRTRMSTEKEILSKRPLRQWLRGQKAVNRITVAERRARLQGLSIKEARQIFEDLHQDGNRWKEFGGDLRACGTPPCRQS